MNKKDFKGMDSIFEKTTANINNKGLNEISNNEKIEPIIEKNREKYSNRTFLIEEQTFKNLKAYSFFNNISQKDIINNALKEFFNKHSVK